MPRGSKPGERRGGRQRATPNKRTVLAERILVVASSNPTATRHELLLILAKDQALPADIRMAIARKSFPAVTSRSVEGGAEKALAWMPLSIARSTNAQLDGGADKIRLTGSRAARAAKMGPKAFPALELLLSIARDGTARPAERRRAALGVAEYYLPKNFTAGNHVAANFLLMSVVLSLIRIWRGNCGTVNCSWLACHLQENSLPTPSRKGRPSFRPG